MNESSRHRERDRRRGLTQIVLAFSKPLDDSATNITHYSLSGGLTVLGASLEPVNKQAVTLTTTLQQPRTPYTVTVNGVFKRNGFHTPIAPQFDHHLHLFAEPRRRSQRP